MRNFSGPLTIWNFTLHWADPKEKSEVRLKRQAQKGLKRVQTLKQIKKMTRQDIEMLREIDTWLSTQYNQICHKQLTGPTG